jgi:hypothetical protein
MHILSSAVQTIEFKVPFFKIQKLLISLVSCPKFSHNWIKKQCVEASETRGTTALIYLQLHSSLYTGTVHVLSSVAGVHPTGLTIDIYRFPRSPIVTSLLYVVPEADAKQLVAAPIKAK